MGAKPERFSARSGAKGHGAGFAEAKADGLEPRDAEGFLIVVASEPKKKKGKPGQRCPKCGCSWPDRLRKPGDRCDDVTDFAPNPCPGILVPAPDFYDSEVLRAKPGDGLTERERAARVKGGKNSGAKRKGNSKFGRDLVELREAKRDPDSDEARWARIVAMSMTEFMLKLRTCPGIYEPVEVRREHWRKKLPKGA